MISIYRSKRPAWHVTFDHPDEPDGRVVMDFATEEEARGYAEIKNQWGKNAKVTHFDFGKCWTIEFYWPWDRPSKRG